MCAHADGAGDLVIFADSLSYYGPAGGLPADDPGIWPNLVAQRTSLTPELFARIGWTSRDVWWALTQDPRIWAAVPKAKVVVIAIGGMDSLPSPLPTALREQIRYVRPARLRQWVRDGYGRVQPRLSPLGWPMAVPPRLTVEYLEKIRDALAQLRPDLPLVVCLPSTHDSPHYGNVHPGGPKTTAAIAAWAAAHGVPTADFLPATAAAFADPDRSMNPDGIHWDMATHREIADVVTPEVARLLDR